MTIGTLLRGGLVAALCAFAAGCSVAPLQTDGPGGPIVEITPLRTYGTLRSNWMLKLAGVKDARVSYRVDCYRVIYASTDEHGRPIQLSGLLALPRDSTPTQLVSYQHGTTSDPQDVPSNMSTDGVAASLLFAGAGYALIAPDYIGHGVSKLPHPYYVATDTARAVIDMIHAVRHVKGVPTGAPLLAGFSQGGYSSLATQRAMEAIGEEVKASASIAGAFNLRSIGVPSTLKGLTAQAPIYIALMVRGYATRYDQPLDSAMTPTYAALVPTLFDTPHDLDELMKALPHDPRKLLQPAALDAIDGHGKHWLVDAMLENDMGDWRAKAPIRMYFGSNDLNVPPEESLTAARQMNARGSNVQAIDLGPLDHDQSIVVAAPAVLEWFRTLH